MTKTDPIAAMWAEEARSRQQAINAQLDALGAPADARGRSEWFERRAEEARLEAGRQDLVSIAEFQADDEQQQIAKAVDETRRERARMAQVAADLAQAGKVLTEMDRREQAVETRRQLAEADSKLAERVNSIRSRLSWTPWNVTASERALVERYTAKAC
jgi:chromosome segregation ATPase